MQGCVRRSHLMPPICFVMCFVICFVIGAFASLSASPASPARETKTESAEVVTSIWNVQKTDDVVELQTLKQSVAVKTKLGTDTLIEGICLHCQIVIKCRAHELSKKCPVCPCELSNAQCLTGKSDINSLTTLLKALPTGTALRVEYFDTSKPEMGVRRLVVDRHKALFAVIGMITIATQDLLKIGKSVGATDVERSEDGKRLQLTLKEDWTVDREARWERALSKVGAKVVFTTAQP